MKANGNRKVRPGWVSKPRTRRSPRWSEKEREGGERQKIELVGAHAETRSVELQKQARKVMSMKVLETVARKWTMYASPQGS